MPNFGNVLGSTASGAGTGFAFGGPVGAGIGAGVGALGGLFGGDDPNKQFYDMLMQLYQNPEMLNRFYQAAYGQLAGQRSRDVRGAGYAGAAEAGALNLSNPYSLIQRGKSDVYSQYAPQFGQLAMQQQQMPMQLLQMLEQASPRQFSFGRDLLPGLLSMGGQLGAARLMKPQQMQWGWGGGYQGSGLPSDWQSGGFDPTKYSLSKPLKSW